MLSASFVSALFNKQDAQLRQKAVSNTVYFQAAGARGSPRTSAEAACVVWSYLQRKSISWLGWELYWWQ